MKKLISIILVFVFALSSFGGVFDKKDSEYKFRDIELGAGYLKVETKIVSLSRDLKKDGKSGEITTEYFNKYIKKTLDDKIDVAGYEATCEFYIGVKNNGDIDTKNPDINFLKPLILIAGKYTISDIKSKEINKTYKDIKDKLIRLYGEPTQEGKSITCWQSKSGKTYILLDCIGNTEIQIGYYLNTDTDNEGL